MAYPTNGFHSNDNRCIGDLGMAGDKRAIGGSLNPTWVEWLMGFPLGWTDLGALGNAVVPQIPEMIGRAIMSAQP